MTKIWSATFQETPFNVYQYKGETGDYGYLISAIGQAIAIDITDGPSVIEELEKNQLTLAAALLTDQKPHHGAGTLYLKEKTECSVMGPRCKEFDFLDQDVADGEESSIGPFSFQVMAMQGINQQHICYFFSDALVLFCGDTLCSSEGKKIDDLTDQSYFSLLQKIKKLPPKTLLFWGQDAQKKGGANFRSLEEEFSQ